MAASHASALHVDVAVRLPCVSSRRANVSSRSKFAGSNPSRTSASAVSMSPNAARPTHSSCVASTKVFHELTEQVLRDVAGGQTTVVFGIETGGKGERNHRCRCEHQDSSLPVPKTRCR